MKDEVLRMERVTYIKEGVTLLDNFNLNIYRGEILGLLCINDNGLEDLIELLAVNKPIHYGRVYFHEQLVNNHLHSNFSRNSVAVIEKRSRLVDQLTVGDNVFVLRDGFSRHVINSKGFETQIQRLSKELDFRVSAGAYVDRLTTFERCMVEMIKAVATGIRLIVIRDVSNFVSAVDLERLHDAVRYYASRGVTFLYICNHHEEIYRICSRTAMMENGRIFRILHKEDMTAASMQTYVDTLFTADAAGGKAHGDKPESNMQAVMEFRDVKTDSMNEMAFTIYPGECLVLLDINNTTQTDFLNLLSGQSRLRGGRILHKGIPVKSAAQRRKIALIREKPAQSMLFPDISYLDNLCFMADRRARALWYSKRKRESVIQQFLPVAGEDIYAPDLLKLSTKSLYNLVYNRTYLQHPDVAVCVQPFSGADYYLRLHVIGLIRKLLERGTAVMILAVSLSDSLQLADRLLVIKGGRICMEYGKEEITGFLKLGAGIESAIE